MTVPASGGTRVDYADLPTELRGWVGATLGSPVVEAVTQHGGFSPGAAARLRTAAGTRAFVKAVSADVNVESTRMHRREGRVLGGLPGGLPVPRLVAAYDEPPWVALLIEDVEGEHPVSPWQEDELRAVLASLRAVSAVPAPELASMAAHVDEWAGFRSLAAHPPPGLDSWVARHLDRLAAVEAEVSTALEGSALVHGDVRADNVLLSAGVAWLVDWPWACAGVPWWDVVTMAPSVAMQGGPAPADLLRLAGVDGDPAAVTVAVTAITGYFLNQSRLPPPPGIPAVRRFQAAQGVIALGWLRERLGWP